MRIRRYTSVVAVGLLLTLSTVVSLLPGAEDQPPGLILSLKGHKDTVYGITFSPDGKHLITTSADPSIKVWRTSDGKDIKTFAGPNGPKGIVLSAAIAPDGSQFAVGSADNIARIYDFPMTNHLREFAHSGDTQSVAVSVDGVRLAAGGKDGKIRLWTTADGKQLHELVGHTGAVTGVAFSPNGQTLVSVGQDATLRYWNVADGKSLAAFSAHPGAITAVSFNTGGNLVYTSGQDGTFRSWGMPPGISKSAPALKDDLTALSVSRDGGQIVTASDKSVRVSAFNNLQPTKDLPAVSGKVNTVSVSSGAAYVAAGTEDRKVYLWQTKDNAALMDAVAHAGAVTGVNFNPAGNLLATVGKDGMLRLWTVPAVPTRTLTDPAAVRAAILSADNKRIVTGGADKLIRLYRIENLKAPERQFSGHTAPVNAVSLSADNNMIVSGGDDHVLRFWNTAKGDQAAGIGAHSGAITSVQFIGTRVLSSSADGSVKLWQMPAITANKGILSHAGVVQSLALSADGNKVLTGCADKQVRLWNLANGQVERTWNGPTLTVQTVAFSPTGDRVAAGSADKTVHVWETGSNKQLHKLTLPVAVQSVAWLGDGKQIVVGLGDGAVKIFNLADGKEVRTLTTHKGGVQAVLLTTKGDQILSTGADGAVVVSKVAGGPPAATWKLPAAGLSLALTRDGTKVAVGTQDKKIIIHTLATGKAEATIETPAEVRGLSWSADGKKIAAAGSDGQARLYSSTGELEEYLAHDGPVNAVAFPASGTRLVTAGSDKTARIWTPSLLWQGRHDGAVTQAILNSRGDRILSAGADGVVRLWNPNDGKLVQAIRAHTGAATGVAMSADGARVVSAGADKTARIWVLSKLPAGGMLTKDIPAPEFALPLPAAAESLSYSPDGKRVAVGVSLMGKEQVRIFDATTGKELLTMGDVDGIPARVCNFLADSRTLLVAGADKTVRLVDVNVVGAWEAHAGGVADVAFNNGGNQLLTGGADKSIKLWNYPTGKLEKTFGPMAGPVTSVAYSPDSILVAATSGKSLKVWTVTNAKEEMNVTLPAPATAVSISNDRQRVAVSCTDGKARVYDIKLQLEVQAFLHTGTVAGTAFHPSQPTLLVSGAGKNVQVDTLSVRTVTPAKTPINGLAPTANGVQVLTACADGKVRGFNPNNGNIDRTLEVAQTPQTCVAVSKNVQLIAVGAGDKKVRLLNYADGKLLSTFTTSANARALSFTPNNQSLVMVAEDGGITSWDTTYQPGQPLPAEFGKVGQTFQHAKEAADIAMASNANLFWTAGADRTIKAWKLASETPVRTFNQPNTVNTVTYNKEGTLLATGCGDGKLRLYDPAKGNQVREINAHAKPNETAIYGVAFSPDGKQVVSASIDQSLKLFNVADGKLIREFRAYKMKEFEKGHQDAVLCVAFSPDGKQIASGSMDRTIKIWNVADGNVVREMVNPTFKTSAHPGWVYALRWVDNGKKLVSVGQAPKLQGYIATWDAASGKLLQGTELAVGTIYTMDVSPDGKTLAIGTGGSVRSERDLNLGWLMKMP